MTDHSPFVCFASVRGPMPSLGTTATGELGRQGLPPGLAQLEGETVKVRISGQHFTKVKKKQPWASGRKEGAWGASEARGLSSRASLSSGS